MKGLRKVDLAEELKAVRCSLSADRINDRRQLTNTEKKLMPHAISQKVKVYETGEAKMTVVECVDPSEDFSQEFSVHPINLMTKYDSV